MSRIKKATLYVDMDGTLCVFDTSKTIEEVAAAGYCRDLTPIVEVVEAIKEIHRQKNIDVKILSAVINDNAINDKIYWLEKYLGKDIANNALFVPCGTDKSEVISDEEFPFLLDDFSKNLHEWKAGGGIGIKIYNGINGNNGTWDGFSVHSGVPVSIVYKQIVGIINAEMAYSLYF